MKQKMQKTAAAIERPFFYVFLNNPELSSAPDKRLSRQPGAGRANSGAPAAACRVFSGYPMPWHTLKSAPLAILPGAAAGRAGLAILPGAAAGRAVPAGPDKRLTVENRYKTTACGAGMRILARMRIRRIRPPNPGRILAELDQFPDFFQRVTLDSRFFSKRCLQQENKTENFTFFLDTGPFLLYF